MNSNQFCGHRHDMTRRRFLGLLGAAGGSAMAVGALGTRFAFATPEDAASGDVIVHVFLRGGMDALGALGPYADPAYIAARPVTKINPSAAFSLNDRLFMHPDMGPLYNGAWKAGKVAIVSAAGMKNSRTRSHFDAERYLANATVQPAADAFMNRYAGQLAADRFNAVGFGTAMPLALAGQNKAFSFVDEPSFRVSGFGTSGQVEPALRTLYGAGTRPLNKLGSETLSVLGIVRGLPADPGPQNGASYADTGRFGAQLEETARLIRANVGLRSVAIEFDGWDTHGVLVSARRQLEYLAKGLQAFYTDLGSAMNEVTVLVVSEFGRTLRENSSGGTDHGVGGAVMAMGGNIIGGVYGAFPGVGALEGSGEYSNALPVLNDYRQVVAEVLTKRGGLSSATLRNVINDPGYTIEAPLGLARAS